MPEPGKSMHATWDDYRKSGGLTLATDHKMDGGVRIRILNLKVTTRSNRDASCRHPELRGRMTVLVRGDRVFRAHPVQPDPSGSGLCQSNSIFDPQPRGMERMPRQEKLACQFIRPAGLDKTEIKLLVRPVNLVPDNRMTEMREMDTDLVRPAGSRNRPDDGERIFPSGAPPNESSFHPKVR